MTAAGIIIRGSKGEGKKNGFGKAANWAADGPDVAAPAPAAVVAAAVVAAALVDEDDELSSDDDSLVAGFSFSPYSHHTQTLTDFKRNNTYIDTFAVVVVAFGVTVASARLLVTASTETCSWPIQSAAPMYV